MLKLKKKKQEVYDVFYENGVFVGQLLCGDDGFYAYWPELKPGYMPEHFLRSLANKLFTLNEEWNEIIQRDFGGNIMRSSGRTKKLILKTALSLLEGKKVAVVANTSILAEIIGRRVWDILETLQVTESAKIHQRDRIHILEGEAKFIGIGQVETLRERGASADIGEIYFDVY